jgi:ParB family transcriptional regulator, chromosome partitioning protein
MSKALGRGLEAIIPGWKKNETMIQDIKSFAEYIPIDKIKPSSNQPRTIFDDHSLAELAESIKEKGVLQPIIVSQSGPGYEIIAGERRYRASKLAGLKEVPVIIKRYNEQEKFEVALLENIQREDLTPIEEAEAYNYLMTTHALTQEELAQKLGKKRATIANCIRLLSLPSNIKEEIKSGFISKAQAKILLSVETNEERLKIIDQIKNQGITIRTLETIVQREKAKKGIGTVKIKDAEILELEEKLIKKFGSKVSVSSSGKGKNIRGSIKINFFNLEDLERILENIL